MKEGREERAELNIPSLLLLLLYSVSTRRRTYLDAATALSHGLYDLEQLLLSSDIHADAEVGLLPLHREEEVLSGLVGVGGDSLSVRFGSSGFGGGGGHGGERG